VTVCSATTVIRPLSAMYVTSLVTATEQFAKAVQALPVPARRVKGFHATTATRALTAMSATQPAAALDQTVVPKKVQALSVTVRNVKVCHATMTAQTQLTMCVTPRASALVQVSVAAIIAPTALRLVRIGYSPSVRDADVYGGMVFVLNVATTHQYVCGIRLLKPLYIYVIFLSCTKVLTTCICVSMLRTSSLLKGLGLLARHEARYSFSMKRKA